MGGIDVRRSLRATSIGMLIAALMVGCSSSYITERYGVNVAPRQIVLGCRDVYEVYDRGDAETILVTTSLGTETSANVCGTGQTKSERMAAVVQRYFVEASKPPACRIIGTTELSPLHFEFGYRCR